MKKVKYLAMLLAAGMFAACSDNLEDTGAGNAGGEQNYEKGMLILVLTYLLLLVEILVPIMIVLTMD